MKKATKLAAVPQTDTTAIWSTTPTRAATLRLFGLTEDTYDKRAATAGEHLAEFFAPFESRTCALTEALRHEARSIRFAMVAMQNDEGSLDDDVVMFLETVASRIRTLAALVDLTCDDADKIGGAK